MSASCLQVDLNAITANAVLLKARARGALMAVVKAEGFGLGAVDVARAALAGGASQLGVTSVEEALDLRREGLTVPVLSWLNPVDADFDAAIRAGVALAVPGRQHLDAVVRAGRRCARPAVVHLHADCGLARDGAPPEMWWSLASSARRAQVRGEVRVAGVMGHLARADTGPDNAGRASFQRFVDVISRAGLGPVPRHLAATSATLTDPASHFDVCRVGAGLVGIDPSGSTQLRATARWTAKVVAVRDVPEGTGIGYGHTFTTSGPTRLANLAIGYGDGVPRVASGRAQVQLNGHRCDIVGRVSMDQTVVDVRDDLTVKIGDEAIVFGAGEDGEPTLSDWAGWADTIPHEILTGIGSRVPRIATRVAAATW
ncbi:alanine racemase [uncultured Jatrophihabitans sp.]|uniref:alanine racemase n=1 Tax=uncultured Jatrophihabitans sp. TaxID=1610747 RepID=UPI0035CA104D